MDIRYLRSFSDPLKHQEIFQIIRKFSTNKSDIRVITLQGIVDLDKTKDILELGCGHGLMAQILAPRVAPDASFIGIDIFAENRNPFIEAVEASGRKASFLAKQIDNGLDWPAAQFDLVVCSYSLYFFTNILPEIARVLKPDGLFLAITHGKDSFNGLLNLLEISNRESPLSRLIQNFSLENGQEKLTKYFGDIESLAYPNQLIFESQDLAELMAYIYFKIPLIFQEENISKELVIEIERKVRLYFEKRPYIIIEKNDAIFYCQKPKWSAGCC